MCESFKAEPLVNSSVVAKLKRISINRPRVGDGYFALVVASVRPFILSA